ncbi:MAG: response regulator [Pseudomonadota bacterium]
MTGRGPICVIDDDEAVRLSMSMSLQAAGYQVEEFESAQRFLDALPDLSPACLVIDLGLPIIDGRGILEKLRDRGVQLPTIMVTGSAGIAKADRERFPEIVDCLEKPFRLSDLTVRITELIGEPEA